MPLIRSGQAHWIVFNAIPLEVIEDLVVGMEMELVLGTLYEDEDTEYTMWKWRPVAKSTAGGEA